MGLAVDLQVADPGPSVPPAERIRDWARAAAGEGVGDAELSVRVVDPAESRMLNEKFRGVAAPTNVLSFPADLPAEIRPTLLGDILICRQTVEREAEDQGKAPEAHWAHMVVHGVLHLLGHDHRTEEQAREMEALEVQILAGLGYPDPYREDDRGSPSAGSAAR
jgi:probable rRNA maturation factor